MEQKVAKKSFVIPVLSRPPLSPEDEEIAKIEEETPQKKYRESPKYLRWVELFMNKSNKETFGNATQSAIIAYGLDPEKQYFTGAQMGNRNVKKVKNLAAVYYAKSGVTHGRMYDIIFNKMIKATTPDMWFMIAEMIGIELPKYQPVSNPATYIYNKKNEVHMEGGDEQLARLTDAELDYLIESKTREVGPIEVITGETAENEAIPAEVRDSAS